MSKAFVVVISLLCGSAFCAQEPVANVKVTSDDVQVQTTTQGEAIFILGGPGGFRVERGLQANEVLRVPLVAPLEPYAKWDQADDSSVAQAGTGFEPLGDGDYFYEVRILPQTQVADLGAVASPEVVQTGMFRIVAGEVVLPEDQRSESGSPVPSPAADDVQTRDVVYTENIIGRSACLSSDALCASGEALGIIDLKMKGNIPLIRWERTGAGDKSWDVDVDLGGFRIAQITDGRAPLLIADAAPTNSVRVDGFGRVGMGTSLPAENLHVVDGTDASLRLQVGGQSWDIFTGSGSTSLRVFNASGGGIPLEITTGGRVKVAGEFQVTSSRTKKKDFATVDREAILARLAALPIYEWSFQDDRTGQRHIGPVSEDFHAAFPLGGDDTKHLTVTDVAGVTLAALQALNERMDRLEAENRKLAAENRALNEKLNSVGITHSGR